MARRNPDYRYLPITTAVPAGTAIAAPQRTNPNVGDVILVSLHLEVPAGHEGLTGFRLDYAGATIVPFVNPGAYIVADNDRFDFDIGMEVGNSLQVVTYNTDYYPHTFYGWAKVQDLPAPAHTPTTLVPITAT